MKTPNEKNKATQVRGEELKDKIIKSEEKGFKYRAEHQGTDALDTKIRQGQKQSPEETKESKITNKNKT